MINHNNQANTSPNYRGTQKLYIAYVNNKDEAMMFNVPKGCTAFLFEYNRPVFYIKSCDEFTNQISFFMYDYSREGSYDGGQSMQNGSSNARGNRGGGRGRSNARGGSYGGSYEGSYDGGQSMARGGQSGHMPREIYDWESNEYSERRY